MHIFITVEKSADHLRSSLTEKIIEEHRRGLYSMTSPIDEIRTVTVFRRGENLIRIFCRILDFKDFVIEIWTKTFN